MLTEIFFIIREMRWFSTRDLSSRNRRQRVCGFEEAIEFVLAFHGEDEFREGLETPPLLGFPDEVGVFEDRG